VEETVNGVVQRQYTYGRQRISENQEIQGAWTPSFYEYDGGGSVRQLINSTGVVTDTYEYDAFGNVLNKTGTTPNNYLYRGEQYDPDLSLYYLRARFYNPVTDRFLSRDPEPGHIAIPHSLHKYLYASGDPVNRLDPRGLADLIELEIEDDNGEAAAEESLPKFEKRIECMLNTASGTLGALEAGLNGEYLDAAITGFTVVEDWAHCTGEEKPTGCSQCFAAGTPVHTDHGDVPIENIHVGDEVEARNSETGKVEGRPVTALTPLHQDSLLEMRVEGERTPLHPSTSHPFWVKRGYAKAGWTRSGQIRAGDLVQSMQGAWRRVVSITPLPGQETVYNFTVANDHDYFVGETGFLVHNADCNCKSRRDAFRTAKRFFKIPNNSPFKYFRPSDLPQFLDGRNRGLYLFTNNSGESIGIREDFPANYPDGGYQDQHFNGGPFNPDEDEEMNLGCHFNW
jgi:RHS repeat-associated protein